MDSEIGFSWAVDNGIRSRAASNLGDSPAHSFASVVDNALSSWRRGPLSHDQRETEEASSALVDIHNLPLNENGFFGFSWAVDNSIRSSAAPDLGESPVHDFASVVDAAIWSRPASYSYSPAHSFASVVDDALSSWRRDPLSHDFTLGLSRPDDFKDQDTDAETLHFRVKGIDGEFDRIFRSLGLSGPEDFAIPAAAWEEAQAQKARVGVASPQAGIKGVRPPVLELPPVASTWSSQQQTVTDPLSDSVSRDDDSDVADEAQIQTQEASSALVDDDSFDIHNLSPNGSVYFQSWQKGEILGKGSFGTVYEGFTDDGNFFAVKEVSLLDDGSQGKQSIFQLQQEISLLSQFRHDNIVRYLGTDKDNDKLYIFLELVTKGSLASLYQKYRLRDSQVSAYTRQILSGLKYLHDRNVVHRDIKCANILVDANGSVKLADFGLAKATKLNDVKSSKGSPYWMAPEVFDWRNPGYGPESDIWSLGCTVLEMMTGQLPDSHLEAMLALFRIGRGQTPTVPESLSLNARDFILKCLQVDPINRPTAAKLLDHAFVNPNIIQEKFSSFADVYQS